MPIKLTVRRFACRPWRRALLLTAGVIAMAFCGAEITGGSGTQSASASRGAYLAAAADCASCHTAGPQQPSFAGGLPINSPLGTMYSTNITPDPIYGIGRYSLEDFTRAVREGIAKDGHRLYPAMPYPSFAGMSDQDIQLLYDYFMHEVRPVASKPTSTELAFPFNQRWGLAMWDGFFANRPQFRANENRDAAWNRGAYLVQAPGHCGACHTPRGLAYEEKADTESGASFLIGATQDNWYAPDLTGNLASGLGRWSEDDIVIFLKTGKSAQGDAFGSMQDVIKNSTQYMSDDDLKAMAHYLKSLPARSESSSYQPRRPAVAAATAAITTGRTEKPGVGFYLMACARCHESDGAGQVGKYPKLGGSSMVLSNDPTSLVRIVLQGAKTVAGDNTQKAREMPPFEGKFTDLEIAEVVSFIRSSWGNQAAPVSAHEVAALRDRLRH